MAGHLLKFRRFVAAEAGQTNVELGAILVLVSIVSVAVLMLIGGRIPPMFQSAAAGF